MITRQRRWEEHIRLLKVGVWKAARWTTHKPECVHNSLRASQTSPLTMQALEKWKHASFSRNTTWEWKYKQCLDENKVLLPQQCAIVIDSCSCLTGESIEQMSNCQVECFPTPTEVSCMCSYRHSSSVQLFSLCKYARFYMYFHTRFSALLILTYSCSQIRRFEQGLENPLSEKRIIWVNWPYSDREKRYPVIPPDRCINLLSVQQEKGSLWTNRITLCNNFQLWINHRNCNTWLAGLMCIFFPL